MGSQQIKEAIYIFRNGNTCLEKNAAFNTYIKPMIDRAISGVFLSLNIHHKEPYILDDIRQEIYLKILTRLSTKHCSGIRSLKNFLFVSARNIAIDQLRAMNQKKAFEAKADTIIKQYEKHKHLQV